MARDKTHGAIGRSFGFIRKWAVTSAAGHDGAVLRKTVTCQNIASAVWADTAYRSRVDEEWPYQPYPPPKAERQARA